MKIDITPLFVALLLITALSALQVSAQLTPSTSLSPASDQAHSTANYYFAKPAELTIIVDVVGMVQRPGRYEISSNINLINLIALAGGGNMDAALDDVKVTRLTELEGKIFMDEIHFNLEDLAKVKRSALTLRPGDVVQIEKSGWSVFRDTFTVLVGAAIITSAVANMIIATR